jgi:hypothetical protein
VLDNRLIIKQQRLAWLFYKLSSAPHSLNLTTQNLKQSIMKKVLGLAIVSLAVFACNDNQQSSGINKDTRDTSTIMETPPPASTETVYVPAEGDYTYKENKVMVMKDGKWVEVDKEVKLDNGTVIEQNGTVRKDGKEVELEEGTVVNKEGNFFDKAGHAIDNAWDATKEGVKKAGNEVEKGAKKVGDKVHDATHDDDDYDKK